MENIDENKNMENGKKVERMKAELEWKDENGKDWNKEKDWIYFRLEMRY